MRTVKNTQCGLNNMDDKINVLFMTVQLETIGGSEKLIYDLASKLDRSLFNPSVCWLTGEKALREFEDLEIPMFHIPKTKRRDISAFIKIRDIILQNKIHVVNAHHFMPMVYSFYGCKIPNRIKLFYTEHSQWEIERISLKWKIVGKYLLNRLDGIIGVSDEVSKALQNKYNLASGKIDCIINGVDINAFKKLEVDNSLKSKLGLANEDKILGMVANLKKVKNHILLLKVFREICNDIKNVKLILIGEGDKNDPENTEDDLKRYVRENGLEGFVYFLGYRSDIPQLINIMDIFCLTSKKEGLPISLIEAMASSLPVIGTDVEGIRDVIVQNKNGFLVQHEDAVGLKNAILTLLNNDSLRQVFGNESRNIVEKYYSFDNCIKKYQDLFTCK